MPFKPLAHVHIVGLFMVLTLAGVPRADADDPCGYAPDGTRVCAPMGESMIYGGDTSIVQPTAEPESQIATPSSMQDVPISASVVSQITDIPRTLAADPLAGDIDTNAPSATPSSQAASAASPPGGTTASGSTAGNAVGGAGSARTFSDIAQNILTSVTDLPGLLSSLSYLLGLLLGVVGILKIKEHVETPRSVDFKTGVVRLMAGGALFALPIIYEAMYHTIGEGGTIAAATLQGVKITMN